MSDEDSNEPLLSPVETSKSNTDLLLDDIYRFDSTGMFYHTSPRSIQDALLVNRFQFENRS
mgnify:CR=1 FL=1